MLKFKVRDEIMRGIFFEKRPNKVPYYLEFLGVNNQKRRGEVIITKGRLKKLVKKLMEVQEFAYDTETNTLRVQAVGDMKLVGISISWGEHNTYYIPTFHAFDKYTLPLETVVKYLKPCFQREDVLIIGQNIKYDLHVVANVGMEIKTKKIFDTMVARWLTDENESKGLKEMTSEIYGIPQTHFDECLTTVTKAERKYLGLSSTAKYIPFYATRIKNGAPYAMADAYWTWRHYVDWCQDLLDEEKMTTIYTKGSMPFLLTLYGMERRGITINKDRLIEMKAEAEKDLEELQYQIYEISEIPFQISSPQQLAEILFGYKKFNKTGDFTGNAELVENSFNFPVINSTPTGSPKTGDDELKALCKKSYKKDKRKQEGIEMVKLIRKYKRLAKLNNAFISGLIEQAYADGKIHPTYNQCGCLTKETLIPTNKGLIPICELASLGKDGEFIEKELVITNRYREDELTKYVVKYENRGTTKIKTTLGYTIEGTNNHPIIKNKYNSLELTNNIGGCRLKELYKGAEEWARLDSLTTNDYVALPYGFNSFSEDLVKFNYDDFNSLRAKNIKLPKYLNEEVAEFIGIYQADGSIHDNNGTFSIRITNGNKFVINRVHYLSKQLFNIEANTIQEPKRNSATTYITGLNLKVVEKAFELKRKDTAKVIPKCILKSPKEVVVAYLKGLTLDSCVIKEANKTYLKFTFANEITARYMQEILLNLGIVSARRQDTTKTNNVHNVLVYNLDYNIFKRLIGFIEPDKYVFSHNNVRHNYRIDEENKTVWLKVRSIEKSQADVYDFNVPETHSFISGAFISHNTDSGRLSCIEENTPITLLNEDKKIKDVKVGDLAYCYTEDGVPTLSKVLRVIDNGVRPCIKIKWQSQGKHDLGELICTPDHKIRLRNGEWIRADELKEGDRVTHLRRTYNSKGRPRIFGLNSYNKLEQLIVKQDILKCNDASIHIHHKDGDKSNNSLDNLMLLTNKEHTSLHAKENVANGTIKYNHLIDTYGVCRGKDNYNYIEITKEQLEQLVIQSKGIIRNIPMDFNTFKKKCKEVNFDYKKVASRFQKQYSEPSEEEFIESYFRNKGIKEHIQKDLNIGRVKCNKLIEKYDLCINHRIISIEYLGDRQVYDLEIEKHHNFIASEICVHNCSNPNLQQLPRPIEMDDPTDFSSWYKDYYEEEPSKAMLDSWSKIEKALILHKGYPTGEVDREKCSIRVEAIEEYLKYLKEWHKKNEDNIFWKFYEIRACFIPDDLESRSLIALD